MPKSFGPIQSIKKQHKFLHEWSLERVNNGKGLLANPKMGLVAGLAVVIGVLIWFPKLQVQSVTDSTKRLELEDKARSTLAQIIGAASAGIYFAYRNIMATERNVKATEDKQVLERFSQAVQMLHGEEKESLRLSGIYLLETVAKSDPNYCPAVLQLLSAFIREYGEWHPPDEELIWLKTVEYRAQGREDLLQEMNEDIEKTRVKAPVLIQEAINTMIWCSHLYHGSSFPTSINLDSVDLRGLHLAGTLYGNKVNLSGTNLRWCNLRGVKFSNFNLRNFSCYGTYFSYSELFNISFVDSELKYAVFQHGKLNFLTFYNCNLEGAKFWNATLKNAAFNETNLIRAEFQYVEFIEEVSFDQAYVTEADFSESEGLTWEQFLRAKSSGGTLLPDYLLENDAPGRPEAFTKEQHDREGGWSDRWKPF